MIRLFFCVFISACLCSIVSAQELYPYAESASTQGRGVPGVRFSYESYRELPSRRPRYWTGLRVVYGLTEKWTAGFSITASNHHQKKFPVDLSNYFANHHQKNFPQNPYQVEGLIASLKYRFLSRDGYRRHLRLAIMGAAAKSFIPHDSAEPRLGDNSGFEGSLIGTWLINRFAISLTNGYLFPLKYKDESQGVTFQSGNSRYLDVSLGYRLIPSSYSDYSNVNINIYLEIINKSYDQATMTLNGQPYSFDEYQYFDKYIYNSLLGNSYTEIRPSIQAILYSTTRVEMGVASPLVNQSYLYFYPMFFISIHKNFYKKPKQTLPPSLTTP